MRKIRVTVGTVGFYDAKHAHKRKTAADGPFECLSLIHISEPTRRTPNLVCRLLLEKKNETNSYLE